MSNTTKDKIYIFDTTLRDGEQSPGATMNQQEKILIAEMLDNMGVDIIEAGFAAASNGDFMAIEAVASHVKNAQVCSLARAIDSDIDAAAAAIKNAVNPRLHTFVSTSAIHIEHQMRSTPEKILQLIEDSVTRARNLCGDVEWSAMDAARTDIDYLCKAVEIAINAGASTINLPDTVGYTIPSEFYKLFDTIKNRVPNIDKARLSVHCHNDLGLAVANSLAAVEAGVRQIECTINGIGERAGNTSLEEVVMAIKTRSDIMDYHTEIDSTQIMKASRLVSGITGFMVQNNKAIVGANAFAHESGIHQDGMLKNAETYEIMTPESVGWVKTNLVMGKHSGRAAFKDKLLSLGFELGDNSFTDAFARFKELADKKKEIYDDDLIALVGDQAENNISDDINFISLNIACGSQEKASATVKLQISGEEKSASSSGDGPVDATFNAIRQLIKHDAKLELYQVSAVTKGIDAQAEVSVRLKAENDVLINGTGANTDTIVASAIAYISALNKLINYQERLVPECSSMV